MNAGWPTGQTLCKSGKTCCKLSLMQRCRLRLADTRKRSLQPHIEAVIPLLSVRRCLPSEDSHFGCTPLTSGGLHWPSTNIRVTFPPRISTTHELQQLTFSGSGLGPPRHSGSTATLLVAIHPSGSSIDWWSANEVARQADAAETRHRQSSDGPRWPLHPECRKTHS